VFHVRQGFLCVLLMLLLFFLANAAGVPREVAPDALIKEVTLDVLSVINEDQDIRSERLLELVEEKILPHLDIAHMTRLALGKHWRDATPREREELTQEFQILLVRTYGSMLALARGKTVSFKKARMSPEDTEAVIEVVVKEGSESVKFQLRMEKTEEGWKVYDLLVEGVSLIMAQRSTFSREIERGGIDGLIEALRNKNHSFKK